jgi:transposase
MLTEGQVHDSQPVEKLISDAQFECLIADKAYDSESIRSLIVAAHADPVIPQRAGAVKPNPHYDRDIYKARHVIENMFAKLKQWRALATRYDKTARNYLAVVNIVAAMVWLG